MTHFVKPPRGTGFLVYTPDTASEILDRNNVGNRPLSRRIVNKFARDMLEGNWAANGETIKFSHSGRLLDGQHRLAAVVKSGVSVAMFTVTGIDESTFDTIDTGKPRSNADIFSLSGVSNASDMSATARLLYGYKYLSGFSAMRNTSPSVRDLLRVMDEYTYEAVDESLRAARHVGKFFRAALAFIHTVGKCADKVTNVDATALLFAKMCGDVPSGKGDPGFTLMRKVVSCKANRITYPVIHFLSDAVKALNATRTGKQIFLMQAPRNFNKAGDFPQIIGHEYSVNDGGIDE